MITASYIRTNSRNLIHEKICQSNFMSDQIEILVVLWFFLKKNFQL